MRSWVNSNLFIALAAMGLTWQTCLQITYTICFDVLSVLVFLGTLHVYIAQRLVKLDSRKSYASAGMSLWLERHPVYVRTTLLVSFIGAAVCFFYLKRETQIGLIVMAVVSMLYALPLMFWLKGRPRLRDFGILKPFILGLVWAATTALLPMLQLGWPLGLNEVLIITERSLFIIALCIPFDIKDMAYDDATMTYKTIPLRLGVRKTLHLTVGMLLLALVVAVVRGVITDTVPYSETLIYALTVFASIYLVYKTRENSDEYHYTFWLDGMLLLQPMLIGLVYVLS